MGESVHMNRLHKGIVVCVSVIGCLLSFLPPADSRAVAQPQLTPVVVALPPTAQGPIDVLVLINPALAASDWRCSYLGLFYLH